jgi:hypothetical protein
MAIFPALQEEARRCGYSLALHGSLKRDMDLVAIAWTCEAVDPDRLVEARAAIDGLFTVEGDGSPKLMPHGRLGWTLHFWPWGKEWDDGSSGRYIDLSVIAPLRRRDALVNG